MQCKTLGCLNFVNSSSAFGYCAKCLLMNDLNLKASSRRLHDKPTQDISSGGDNDYWIIDIKHSKRLQPCKVECEDLIAALELDFFEGEAFKAIFRKAKARMGDGKPGDTALRNAEKVRHMGVRMVDIEKNKANQ